MEFLEFAYLISDLIEGVRGVGDELSEEDLLVGVEGVDDQTHQLGDLRLEGEGLSALLLLGHFEVLLEDAHTK